MRPPLPADPISRSERARLALDGLSVGDAFGQRFIHPDAETMIAERDLPSSPWYYTDDTEMALGVLEVLARHGRIDQDDLALTFGRRYLAEPMRGYGGAAHGILAALGAGADWRAIAGEVFGGQGSMGNGSAMRVAPVGAYFADDLSAVVEQARASAAVTHAHPDGQAGAIAVAVAAASAWHLRGDRSHDRGQQLLATVLEHTPDGPTRRGLVQAAALPLELSSRTAASLLGDGSRVICWDTVPFALWCAARHLDNYVEAMWATVAGLGDRDTTCAIVGGVVALSAGPPPAEWLAAREPVSYPDSDAQQ